MSTAQRYNLAYNYVFEKQPSFKKEVLINGSKDRSDDRFMSEFTKEVCKLAESDVEIPVVKSNYVVPQTSGVK